MHGKNGAAHIFAPQKGANRDCVEILDHNLASMAGVMKKVLNRDIASIPGSGAAGAMGAGVVAFLNGELKSGIDTILDLIHFDYEIEDADLIFTGEGRLDAQSLGGKVVIGISKRARKKNIPVIAVTGEIGSGAEGAYELGVNSIISINTSATAFEIARNHSKENLAITMDNIIRTLLIPYLRL